ncbi:serine/threonine protein kinase [Rhodopirellula europaea]|uniref:Serine/threonine protein kinase with PASTA sensor(S) n=1 Tax=Rhodopirellula europaea 6C TaxID=1263867 RepID=M2AJU2_9BACT|nr:serine/threonine-protein kinase [Rhodopirellula europaea]EMB17405.1 serine/threonine protein kinase with PASTA sensor(s) [Rhodopirellula europaea 6C]
MTETLSPVAVFREAALRSDLLKAEQWERAAKEVKQNLASEDRLNPELVCEEMSKVLVRDRILTPYQSQQIRAGRTKLTLGNYVITEFLGQGGMGQVFGGVHKIMGRQCAIKVLPLQKSDPLSLESFAREIRLQSNLDSPYLVRAFDAGKDGKVHYLVTEYVPGTDLRRLVREHGRLSMQQAASIIAQAAAGLAYAHESGLVHRDVKPANIMVTPDGHAKVSDVGLAALSFGPDDDPRAGMVVGTADYLSPEQIRTPDQVGPPSDIYSLGCTLYYACTGSVPFPGGDSKSKCRRHLNEMPLKPTQHAPELSEAFVDTIADMMEKEVSRRITTAAEVVMRLSPWATMDADTNDSGSIQIGEGMQPVAIPAAGIPSPEDSFGESMLDEMSWDNVGSAASAPDSSTSSTSSVVTPPPPPRDPPPENPASAASQATGISSPTWLVSILVFTAIGFLFGYLTARGVLF